MSSADPSPAGPPDDAHERPSIWERMPRWISIPGFLIVVLAVWQGLFDMGLWSELIMPPPTQVAAEMVEVLRELAAGGPLWSDIGLTMTEIAVGYVIAVVLGFSLGIVVAETAFGRIVLMPYVIAINSMPKVAFAPLFVGWFGFGVSSKIAVVVFVSFFPVLIATAAGLASSDRDETGLFRALLASRVQTLFKLKLPNALPFIFTGLKTSAVLAIIGAIIGEFLGAAGGIGQLIRVAGSQLEIARLFAYVFLLGALGSILFQFITWLEARLVFWRAPERPHNAEST